MSKSYFHEAIEKRGFPICQRCDEYVNGIELLDFFDCSLGFSVKVRCHEHTEVFSSHIKDDDWPKCFTPEIGLNGYDLKNKEWVKLV